jgi:hypothetical protein
MNRFNYLEKSIEIANGQNYLSDLFMWENSPYYVDSEEILNTEDELKGIFQNAIGIIDLDDFADNICKLSKNKFSIPCDNMNSSLRYISSLKKSERFVKIEKNRTLFRSIKEHLVDKENDFVHLNLAPKSSSRRFGQSAKKYIKTIKDDVFTFEYSDSNEMGVHIDTSSDKKIKQRAKSVLNTDLKKGRDFFVKFVNSKTSYAIGEIKYTLEPGGDQDNAIEDGLSILDGTDCFNILCFDGGYNDTRIKKFKKSLEEKPHSFIISIYLLRDLLLDIYNEN